MNAALASNWAAHPALRCNTGGPSSRVRKEHLASTLLGRDDGLIDCPSVVRIALDFGRGDPVAFMRRLLAAKGVASPEDLRETLQHPRGRLNLVIIQETAVPLQDGRQFC